MTRLRRLAQAGRFASPVRMRRLLLLAVILILPLAAPDARAQEYIAVPGPLTDTEFYRLIACAAPPGGACAKPLVRWNDARRRNLRIGIADVAPSFPSYKLDLVDRAIDAAITEINATGADLFLRRVYEGDLDIPIYLIATPQGGRIAGTSMSELDGTEMAIGRVAIRSRGAQIFSAAIAISQDIRRREIASVLLEELVQAMGLPTDIAGPGHERSIFFEYSNSTVWLRGQDVTALRLHYPATDIPPKRKPKSDAKP